MSHITLYRKYRPKSFSQVVGQDAVVQVVKNKILSGKVPHAFLFSGPRGSGKTTVARLLAKALNCSNLSDEGEPCGECSSCRAITEGSSLDVIEIDGASHRGIDNIRELKEHVCLAPFSSPYKVYIIDEVHMVTTDGFNALLKTLEEPPSYVVFVLATTEPKKVPVTIRSRCQHVPFHRIKSGDIVSCLKNVLLLEGVEADDDALWEIAREADGSLRDALSILEQALAFAGDGKVLKLDAVNPMLGGGSRKDMERLMVKLRTDSRDAFYFLQQLLSAGLTSKRLFEGLYELARDLWALQKWGPSCEDALPISQEEKEFLKEEMVFWEASDLWNIMKFCVDNIARANLGVRSDVAASLVLGFFEEMKPVQIPQEQVPKRREEAKTEGPKPVDVKKEKGFPSKVSWEEFHECFYPDDIMIYCALASAEPIFGEDDVEIQFSLNHRLAFELLKVPRNLRKLRDAAKKLLGGKKVLLRLEDCAIDLDEADLPQNDNETSPNVMEVVAEPSQSYRKESTANKRGEQVIPTQVKKRSAEPKNGNGLKDTNLRKLMQLIDGEILLIKEEDSMEANQESEEEVENE